MNSDVRLKTGGRESPLAFTVPPEAGVSVMDKSEAEPDAYQATPIKVYLIARISEDAHEWNNKICSQLKPPVDVYLVIPQDMQPAQAAGGRFPPPKPQSCQHAPRKDSVESLSYGHQGDRGGPHGAYSPGIRFGLFFRSGVFRALGKTRDRVRRRADGVAQELDGQGWGGCGRDCQPPDLRHDSQRPHSQAQAGAARGNCRGIERSHQAGIRGCVYFKNFQEVA